MHGADVVENIRVPVSPHEKKNGEVEAPEHLGNSQPAIVLFDIKEGKVTKSSHPNIAGDHDAD